jgi:hypothetical protein
MIGDLYFRDRGDVVEVHMVVPDQPPPRRRVRDGHRRQRDTEPRMYRGAPEGDAEAPVNQPGFPDDPPDEGPDTAGGLQEELFVDARSLRISGRDANGKNFEAMVYGPAPEGADPRGWPGGDSKRGLMAGVTDFLPEKLRSYQSALDAHYRRR